MNPIQTFLDEAQEVNSTSSDKRYGCNRIANYHRRRLCQIDARMTFLKNRYAACKDEKCKAEYSSKISKWREKLNREMASKTVKRGI